MSNILIIEDDQNINQLICDVLKKNNYECTQAYSGSEALLLIERSSFDLIILDLMLPGFSGEEVIKRIRPAHSMPIIIVSAKDELDSKVNLLTLGADDYITKPFEIQELLVRVMVQLRKSGASAQSALVYKGLTLNKANFTMEVDGQEIDLTKQEFKILELLLTYPTRVFSKQDIYEYAWDNYYIGEDKTINVHISNIRAKLKKVTDIDYIDTVWGIGFRLSK